MVIPADLRDLVGRRELKRSLMTDSMKKAKARAKILSAELEQLFTELREQRRLGTMPEKLTKGKIQGIISDYVRGTLDANERERASGSKVLDFHTLDDELNDIASLLHDRKVELSCNDYSFIERRADWLLEGRDIELEKDADVYKLFCRQLLIAQVKLLEVELDRARGDYGADDETLRGYLAAPAGVVESQSTSVSLEALIEDYKKEKFEISEDIKERSKTEYIGVFNTLVWVFGEGSPVQSITFERMKQFRDVLLHLPQRFQTTKKYRGKTVDDIMRMDLPQDKRISPATIEKYLGIVKGLFTFAKRHRHYTGDNPVDGLLGSNRKAKVRADKQQDPFSIEDLRLLFHSPEYINDTHRQPSQFWVPILGLYTGARIEEICQLQVDDVRLVDGLWVISIVEDSPEKSVKTLSSERMVPLHPFLIDNLKFHLYIESVRSEGHTRIFPELKRVQEKWGHYVSKWFNSKYKKDCGIVAPLRKKTFHSFRHTVATMLSEAEVQEKAISELLGHSQSGQTAGRYIKPYKPESLYQRAVLKLDYEGLGLGHLKESKYCGQVE